MKVLIVAVAVFAGAGAVDVDEKGLGPKAASNRVNCNCQCADPMITFTDKYGRVHGNCNSADNEGIVWCYVDPRYSNCRDLKRSNRNGLTHMFISGEACNTPALGSSLCYGGYNNGYNNGFGNNNNGFNNGFGNNNGFNNGFGNNNNGYGNNNNGCYGNRCYGNNNNGLNNGYGSNNGYNNGYGNNNGLSIAGILGQRNGSDDKKPATKTDAKKKGSSGSGAVQF